MLAVMLAAAVAAPASGDVLSAGPVGGAATNAAGAGASRVNGGGDASQKASAPETPSVDAGAAKTAAGAPAQSAATAAPVVEKAPPVVDKAAGGLPPSTSDGPSVKATADKPSGAGLADGTPAAVSSPARQLDEVVRGAASSVAKAPSVAPNGRGALPSGPGSGNLSGAVKAVTRDVGQTTSNLSQTVAPLAGNTTPPSGPGPGGLGGVVNTVTGVVGQTTSNLSQTVAPVAGNITPPSGPGPSGLGGVVNTVTGVVGQKLAVGSGPSLVGPTPSPMKSRASNGLPHLPTLAKPPTTSLPGGSGAMSGAITASPLGTAGPVLNRGSSANRHTGIGVPPGLATLGGYLAGPRAAMGAGTRPSPVPREPRAPQRELPAAGSSAFSSSFFFILFLALAPLLALWLAGSTTRLRLAHAVRPPVPFVARLGPPG